MLKNLVKTFLALTAAFLAAKSAQGHHFKGLPHNDYFENYPQVPSLEFLYDDGRWEMFVTIFNFDGIDLDNVQDRDLVRFYVFVYDLKEDRVYKGGADFEFFSDGSPIGGVKGAKTEQENIFVLQQRFKDQSDLALKAYLKDGQGAVHTIELPFQIKKSLWQKARVPILIIIFFFLIGAVKACIRRKEVYEKECH